MSGDSSQLGCGAGVEAGAGFLCVCLHSSVVGEEKRCFLNDPSEFLPERPLSPKDSSRREQPTAEERVHCDPHAGEAQARSHSKRRALSLSLSSFSRKILVLLSGQEEEGEAERQSVLVAHPSFLKRLKFALIRVPKRSISGCRARFRFPPRTEKNVLSRFTEMLPKGLAVRQWTYAHPASSSKHFYRYRRKDTTPTRHGLPKAMQLSPWKGDPVACEHQSNIPSVSMSSHGK